MSLKERDKTKNKIHSSSLEVATAPLQSFPNSEN